jgi:RNA polymerase sigma-70 factor (ECF subfamily)
MVNSMSDQPGDAVTVVSDALLLARFRAGDESCFEALFERHYDRVYGVLFRLTGTRAEAEDIAQEVFLKLYQSRLRHGENIAGWLYRVASNMGYNALRASARRARREQQAAASEALTEDRLPGPEERVTRQEARQAAQAALVTIRPRLARLLILREMGFSYQELADIVGVAPGSVGTLLARAREAFEKAYVQQQGEEG